MAEDGAETIRHALPASWNYVILLLVLKSARSVLSLFFLALIFGVFVRLLERESPGEMYLSLLDKAPVAGAMGLTLFPIIILFEWMNFRKYLKGKSITSLDRASVRRHLLPGALKWLSRWDQR